MRLAVLLTILFAGQIVAQDRSARLPDRLFEPQGVEFTAGQKETIEILREEASKKMTEIQLQLNGIYTVEQRQAQRETMRSAREAGKTRQEALEAVQAAVQLTDKQKKTIDELREQRSNLLTQTQKDVLALLTPEQRQNLERRQPRAGQNQQLIKPTHANLQYGPANRNVMDVWLAESDKPTPVLVSIHGGGFRGGNKGIDRGLLRQCLDAGISAVAITYRLSDEAIAPAQMMDSARAIQFIRHHSEQWNLDPEKIAATGGSAGAGISLWLGFHDDLADPDNQDPVLQESTRLTCMYVNNGQTSYDPRFIRKMFPDANVYQHSALSQLYDVDLDNLEDLSKEKYELFEQISPINFLTKDDPPVALSYGRSMDSRPDIHHPLFGKLLKEKMDRLGIRCEVYAGREALGGGERLSTFEFIQQEFTRK